MTIFNHPIKTKGYTTRFELPNWYRTKIFDNIKRIGIKVIETKRIGDFKTDNLKESILFDKPLLTKWSESLEYSKSIVPLDEPDCCEWMIYATANNAYISSLDNEYTNGVILFHSDDAFIPGLSVEDFKFKSEEGSVITKNGYAILITPSGNFNVPVPGKQTIISKDSLGWGAVPLAYIKQWVGNIVKFKKLSKNPEERCRFPVSGTDAGFMVGPLFFVHEADRFAFRNFTTLGITSEKPQTVQLVFRHPNDYTQIIGKTKVNLKEGQNEVNLKIRSPFGIPPMVVEAQPQDNITCYLDYYKVKP